MGGNQYDGVAPRMPINRRVGVLDKVLADAVDWYVDQPLDKPWQGGERGDPYIDMKKTEENHRRVNEAARAFLSEFADAITDLNYRLQGLCAVKMFRTSDIRRQVSSRKPSAGAVETEFDRRET